MLNLYTLILWLRSRKILIPVIPKGLTGVKGPARNPLPSLASYMYLSSSSVDLSTSYSRSITLGRSPPLLLLIRQDPGDSSAGLSSGVRVRVRVVGLGANFLR